MFPHYVFFLYRNCLLLLPIYKDTILLLLLPAYVLLLDGCYNNCPLLLPIYKDTILLLLPVYVLLLDGCYINPFTTLAIKDDHCMLFAYFIMNVYLDYSFSIWKIKMTKKLKTEIKIIIHVV